MMRRRDFITLLGGAAAAWAVAARAQQAGKPPTIGFLGSNALTWTVWTAAFVERLRAVGWVEGRTIIINYRWTEGRPERVAEVAAEFVRLKVDAIVTDAIAVPALKQATAVIPIVFALALDPVGNGLVATLAADRGRNVTGLSLQQTDLAGKRLELLREVVPRLRRLAIIANVGYPAAALEMGEVQAAGRTLGIEVARKVVLEGQSLASVWVDGTLPWLIIYTVGLSVLGWLVFLLNDRRAMRRGTLR